MNAKSDSMDAFDEQQRQIRFTAIFPIHAGSGCRDMGVTEAWLIDGLIRQLPRLSCDLRLPKEKSIPVIIYGVSRKGAKTIFGGHFSRLRTDTIRLVKFEVTATFNSENWRLEKDDSSKNRLHYFCENIRIELENLAYRLTLAANIARPGSMVISSDGIMFCEGYNYRCGFPFWKLYNEIGGLVAPQKDQYWPKIKYLRLHKVWNWLNALPDFKKGYGSSPLGRGLAAFTYLFSYGSDSEYTPSAMPLVYLMSIVGLEALYDSNGSFRTLKEHCDMFLSHPKRNEKLGKAIKDLYGRRSAIIHGQLPMPFKFCADESYQEVDNAMQKVWSLDEATPIFIATLQKMAELKIHELEFGWKPKPKAK
jgi:hypothetical protein